VTKFDALKADAVLFNDDCNEQLYFT